MGGTSKQLMMLLSCSQPFPLLYPPRPFALRLILHSRVSASLYSLSKRRFSSSNNNNYRTLPLPLPHPQLSFSINSSPSSPRNNFHAGRGNGEFFASAGDPVPPQPFASSSISNFRFSHPWPEWSNLVDNLRLAGYFDNRPQEEDAFSVFENLPQEFVQASSACLAFARQCSHLLGSLSKKDIEVVVQNGSPFLFKSAVDTVTRMKSFLASSNHQNSELVFESAPMVDLMRFLLSYVYNPVVSDRTNLSTGEQVESSVRNLLRELAYESRIVQESDFSSSMPKQFPDGYGQTLRPIRQNIEMKRGDWICPKCTFMNFARNMNCLECNEIRPKRQLNGGEWHCPQCDFFNYGKNAVCIRCDCRRPAEVSGSASPRLDFKYDNADNSGILNTRAALSEQRMASGQYQGTLGNAGSPEGRNFQSIGLGPGKTSGTNQNLDRIFDRSSEGSKSEYVPFKPLPSDMFNKPQSKTEAEQVTNINSFAAAKLNQPRTSSNSDDTLPLSKKPVNQTESEEDIEQAKKSERWFKKVAELHDVTDLASAISDEDFPEIMPMRKGENRFVVSKKKDRSLTSPLHKRRMAMEQTSSTTNFVPFVPFPPDYFAKKDKVPETEAPAGKDMSGNSAFASPEAAGVAEKFKEQKEGNIGSGPFTNSRQSTVNQPNFVESRVNYSYGRVAGNSRETADDLQTGDRQSWSGGSGAENRTNAKSATGNSTQQWENAQNTKESWRGGFSGKSLEGSLVKEPDPLDMSEEAKAERWFRRAAQIKDISELSQIPDEDFPQIMPMRKGVNRFVVSKRKTPLERRLTSPQYRRNLPIVSSEPVEKDNSDS